jgi:GGDEF domain-containing protein
VRDALHGDPLVHEGHVIRFTASLGVAIYPDCGGDSSEVVAAADAALLRAKAAGKDRVELALRSESSSLADSC